MSKSPPEPAPSGREGVPEKVQLGPAQSLYLFGVARAKSWRGGRVNRVSGEEILRVRYRDLEALVRAATYELPPLDEECVLAHQKVVEAAMRRGTVLPLPYGVIFRGRRQLIRMLQEQYLVIDEALSLLEGHWELRLHVSPAISDASEVLGDLAMDCYAELRRHARAAVPLPRDGRRLLTAAFLVERVSWVEFVERADDLGAAHPDLVFDVTGPWPAYDFVRITT